MESFENLSDTTHLADIGCSFKLVNDLIPYARNSRDHSEGQVSKIAASIKEFKFLNPVIIDGDNGIIAGHGRVLAAKKINMTHVPVVDGSHLSELQRRAYVIADNKIALDSTWDDELLKIELKDLKLADFDLDLTGFDLPEIEELFAGDEDDEIKEGLIDDDEVPDVDKNEYGVKRGRCVGASKHRPKCGNSTNEGDVADLMQGEKADMVFTDPPYGVSYQSNGRTASEKFAVLKNDNVFLNFKDLILENTKSDVAIFIWTSHHVFSKWFSMYESIYKSTVIWYKASGGMGDLSGDYATDFEMALYCVKGKPKFINGRPMAVWQIKKTVMLLTCTLLKSQQPWLKML